MCGQLPCCSSSPSRFSLAFCSVYVVYFSCGWLSWVSWLYLELCDVWRSSSLPSSVPCSRARSLVWFTWNSETLCKRLNRTIAELFCWHYPVQTVSCVFMNRISGNWTGWPQTFSTQGWFLWMWKTQGILCNSREKLQQSCFSLSFKHLPIFGLRPSMVLGFKWTMSCEFLTHSKSCGDLFYCWSWCAVTLDERHYYVYCLLWLPMDK